MPALRRDPQWPAPAPSGRSARRAAGPAEDRSPSPVAPGPTLLRWRGVPLHALVLATALVVERDRRPPAVVALLRGLLVHMVYRTLCREVMVLPGRAVLVWSVVHPGAVAPAARLREAVRRGWAVLVSVAAGLVVSVASLGGILLVVDAGLRAVGVGPGHTVLVLLLLTAAATGATGWRALVAYLVERRRQRHMRPGGPGPTWRLDLLGAPDSGKGYGGRLLEAFLRHADAAGAEVFLVTRPENEHFFRRRGLRVLPVQDLDGMLLMRSRCRPAATGPAARPAPQAAERRYRSGTRPSTRTGPA